MRSILIEINKHYKRFVIIVNHTRETFEMFDDMYLLRSIILNARHSTNFKLPFIYHDTHIAHVLLLISVSDYIEISW